MAVAPSKPTPGTVAMRRARSFERNEASRSCSSCRIRRRTSIACSAKAAITVVARSGTSFASPATAPDECQSVRDAFGDVDAELGQESPDHVDELGALADEEITRPMQRERDLLLDRLDRDEAHARGTIRNLVCGAG